MSQYPSNSGAVDSVGLTSNGDTVAITPSGSPQTGNVSFNLEVSPSTGAVDSVELTSDDGSVEITPTGAQEGTVIINLKVPALTDVVNSLTLTSTGNTVAITPTGSQTGDVTINLEAEAAAGITALTSFDGTIVFDPDGSTVDLSAVQLKNLQAVAPAGTYSLYVGTPGNVGNSSTTTNSCFLFGDNIMTQATTATAVVGVGSSTFCFMQSGTNCAALGQAGFFSTTTGSFLTGIGVNFGRNNVDGSNIICIGYNAGDTYLHINNGIFIGDGADSTAENLINICAIGHGAEISISNAMNIGVNQRIGINQASPQEAIHISNINDGTKPVVAALALDKTTTNPTQSATTGTKKFYLDATTGNFSSIDSSGNVIDYDTPALAPSNNDAIVLAATYGLLDNQAGSYSNGTAGVGATLTFNPGGTYTIEGFTVDVDDTILLLSQNDSTQNGKYVATTVTTTNVVLTRSPDADNSSTGKLVWGQIFSVAVGTGLANSCQGTQWQLQPQGLGISSPIVVGTSSLLFQPVVGFGASVLQAWQQYATFSSNTLFDLLDALSIRPTNVFSAAGLSTMPTTFYQYGTMVEVTTAPATGMNTPVMYRFDPTSTATPNGINIVAALGGGNWILDVYSGSYTSTISSAYSATTTVKYQVAYGVCTLFLGSFSNTTTAASYIIMTLPPYISPITTKVKTVSITSNGADKAAGYCEIDPVSESNGTITIGDTASGISTTFTLATMAGVVSGEVMYGLN